MKMLISLLLLGLSFQALSAGPAEDDHEGALLVLEGKDAVSRKECKLFVMDLGFTGPEETPEQFYADVTTSYTHGNDKPQSIRVTFDTKNNSILKGVGTNLKDEVALFTEPGSTDLAQVKSFNLRWFHNNHFDNFRCLQLKVHEH